MPVVALLDVAGPPALEVSGDPSAAAIWSVQAEIRPRMAISRMLKYAAPSAYGGQSCRKASVIVAELELVRLARAAVPEPTPTLTWRMGRDRIGAGIGPGVARLWPRVHAGQVGVAAV